MKPLKTAILLDNSLQIEKFKGHKIQQWLNKNRGSLSYYSSYYVLYEFKTGLISSAISFYNIARITDNLSDAFDIWSDRFSVRDQKNGNLITSSMLKLSGSINGTDKTVYLAQIETVIFHWLSQFDCDLVSLVGGFGSHPLVKYEINDRDSYNGYVELCSKEKCIKLADFWEKNSGSLTKLISEKSKMETHAYLKSSYDLLVKIELDLLQANKIRTAKKLGDIVITVDAPMKFTIAATDNSFEILTKILKKRHLHVDKNNPQDL